MSALFRDCAVRMSIETRRPVSRVLSVPRPCKQEKRNATVIPLDRPLLDGSRDLPGRLGPASPTVIPKDPARRPYSVLLQAGLAMPSLSPGPRWALTPPFHPSPPSPQGASAGGLLSVALSLGSPPAGVTRRLFAVEPGLSSTPQAGPRPPGRLVRVLGWAGPQARSRATAGPGQALPPRRAVPLPPLRGVGNLYPSFE